MTSAVTIRDYWEADFSPLLALEQQAFVHPQTEKQLQLLLRSPSRAWVAEGQQQLLGFAIVRTIAAEAELLDIAVAPACQGLQVAQKLLQQVLRCLRNAGVDDLFLEVRASNARAIGFYRKHGFAQVGRRPGYYSNVGGGREDAILMRLSLDKDSVIAPS